MGIITLPHLTLKRIQWKNYIQNNLEPFLGKSKNQSRLAIINYHDNHYLYSYSPAVLVIGLLVVLGQSVPEPDSELRLLIQVLY